MNILAVFIITMTIVMIGFAWEQLHTCSREGCQMFSSDTSPARLCAMHSEQARCDADRYWATRDAA